MQRQDFPEPGHPGAVILARRPQQAARRQRGPAPGAGQRPTIRDAQEKPIWDSERHVLRWRGKEFGFRSDAEILCSVLAVLEAVGWKEGVRPLLHTECRGQRREQRTEALTTAVGHLNKRLRKHGLHFHVKAGHVLVDLHT